MNKIIRYIPILLILQLIMESGKAQSYDAYQSTNAVLLLLKGNTQTESRLDEAFITLSGSSNVLEVRVRIPYHLINYKPADSIVSSSLGLTFDLAINVNSWQIQGGQGSGRTYLTHGLLRLNNISKPAIVEYTPLPAGDVQDGSFNLSMIIKFNPYNFNLDGPNEKERFIIKISDAKVNRL
ncbi:MAG TPA: hypothetical protein VF939_08115 [Puia sp.]